MVRAIERRVSRLEARFALKTPSVMALLRIVGPDGQSLATLAPREGGGWRPVTEEEISAAAMTMNEDDLGVM